MVQLNSLSVVQLPGPPDLRKSASTRALFGPPPQLFLESLSPVAGTRGLQQATSSTSQPPGTTTTTRWRSQSPPLVTRTIVRQPGVVYSHPAMVSTTGHASVLQSTMKGTAPAAQHVVGTTQHPVTSTVTSYHGGLGLAAQPPGVAQRSATAAPFSVVASASASAPPPESRPIVHYQYVGIKPVPPPNSASLVASSANKSAILNGSNSRDSASSSSTSSIAGTGGMVVPRAVPPPTTTTVSRYPPATTVGAPSPPVAAAAAVQQPAHHAAGSVATAPALSLDHQERTRLSSSQKTLPQIEEGDNEDAASASATGGAATWRQFQSVSETIRPPPFPMEREERATTLADDRRGLLAPPPSAFCSTTGGGGASASAHLPVALTTPVEQQGGKQNLPGSSSYRDNMQAGRSSGSSSGSALTRQKLFRDTPSTFVQGHQHHEARLYNPEDHQAYSTLTDGETDPRRNLLYHGAEEEEKGGKITPAEANRGDPRADKLQELKSRAARLKELVAEVEQAEEERSLVEKILEPWRTSSASSHSHSTDEEGSVRLPCSSGMASQSSSSHGAGIATHQQLPLFYSSTSEQRRFDSFSSPIEAGYMVQVPGSSKIKRRTQEEIDEMMKKQGGGTTLPAGSGPPVRSSNRTSDFSARKENDKEEDLARIFDKTVQREQGATSSSTTTGIFQPRARTGPAGQAMRPRTRELRSERGGQIAASAEKEKAASVDQHPRLGLLDKKHYMVHKHAMGVVEQPSSISATSSKSGNQGSDKGPATSSSSKPRHYRTPTESARKRTQAAASSFAHATAAQLGRRTDFIGAPGGVTGAPHFSRPTKNSKRRGHHLPHGDVTGLSERMTESAAIHRSHSLERRHEVQAHARTRKDDSPIEGRVPESTFRQECPDSEGFPNALRDSSPPRIVSFPASPQFLERPGQAAVRHVDQQQHKEKIPPPPKEHETVEFLQRCGITGFEHSFATKAESDHNERRLKYPQAPPEQAPLVPIEEKLSPIGGSASLKLKKSPSARSSPEKHHGRGKNDYREDEEIEVVRLNREPSQRLLELARPSSRRLANVVSGNNEMNHDGEQGVFQEEGAARPPATKKRDTSKSRRESAAQRASQAVVSAGARGSTERISGILSSEDETDKRALLEYLTRIKQLNEEYGPRLDTSISSAIEGVFSSTGKNGRPDASWDIVARRAVNSAGRNKSPLVISSARGPETMSRNKSASRTTPAEQKRAYSARGKNPNYSARGPSPSGDARRTATVVASSSTKNLYRKASPSPGATASPPFSATRGKSRSPRVDEQLRGGPLRANKSTASKFSPRGITYGLGTVNSGSTDPPFSHAGSGSHSHRGSRSDSFQSAKSSTAQEQHHQPNTSGATKMVTTQEPPSETLLLSKIKKYVERATNINNKRAAGGQSGRIAADFVQATRSLGDTGVEVYSTAAAEVPLPAADHVGKKSIAVTTRSARSVSPRTLQSVTTQLEQIPERVSWKELQKNHDNLVNNSGSTKDLTLIPNPSLAVQLAKERARAVLRQASPPRARDKLVQTSKRVAEYRERRKVGADLMVARKVGLSEQEQDKKLLDFFDGVTVQAGLKAPQQTGRGVVVVADPRTVSATTVAEATSTNGTAARNKKAMNTKPSRLVLEEKKPDEIVGREPVLLPVAPATTDTAPSTGKKKDSVVWRQIFSDVADGKTSRTTVVAGSGRGDLVNANDSLVASSTSRPSSATDHGSSFYHKSANSTQETSHLTSENAPNKTRTTQKTAALGEKLQQIKMLNRAGSARGPTLVPTTTSIATPSEADMTNALNQNNTSTQLSPKSSGFKRGLTASTLPISSSSPKNNSASATRAAADENFKSRATAASAHLFAPESDEAESPMDRLPYESPVGRGYKNAKNHQLADHFYTPAPAVMVDDHVALFNVDGADRGICNDEAEPFEHRNEGSNSGEVAASSSNRAAHVPQHTLLSPGVTKRTTEGAARTRTSSDESSCPGQQHGIGNDHGSDSPIRKWYSNRESEQELLLQVRKREGTSVVGEEEFFAPRLVPQPDLVHTYGGGTSSAAGASGGAATTTGIEDVAAVLPVVLEQERPQRGVGFSSYDFS
ncbi:unnamed protein product [Amoebophrya sp. A120]|nr:unnamed protein product [Amoebophrya sp. A120]|eukprot:GSA120T00018261001.1